MDECSIDGCNEPMWVIGLCHVHGKRHYKYGDEKTYVRRKRKRFTMEHEPCPGFLWCSICIQELPMSSFDKSQDDGYRKVGRCKTCMGLVKASSKYNISIDDLLEMERGQDGRCAICRKAETKPWRMSLDHDHTCCSNKSSCGKCVRELLCDSCNRMIGLANDNIELLQAAISYLQKWSSRGGN